MTPAVSPAPAWSYVLTLAIAAPLLLLPTSVSAAGFLVLGAPWLWSWWRVGRAPLDSHWRWPILGLLLMSGVGLVVSSDLRLSLPRFYGILFDIDVFAVLVEVGRGRIWRLAAGAGLLMALLGVSTVALVGTAWKSEHWGGLALLQRLVPHLVQQVQGTAARVSGFNPNEVGGILGLLVPLAVSALLLRRWDRWSAPAAVVAGLSGLTLLLTESRGALAGVCCGLLLLLGLRWRLARWLWLGPPVGLVLALVWLGPQRVAALLLAVDVATGSSALSTRLELWQRALAMIADFPLTGIGLNNISLLSSELYPVFSWPVGVPMPHAHDLYLQTALDLGLPGLVFFCWLLARVGLALGNAWRRNAAGERWLIGGLAAGLVSHLTFNITDAVTLGSKPDFLFWAVLGLAAALRTSASPPTSARQSTWH